VGYDYVLRQLFMLSWEKSQLAGGVDGAGGMMHGLISSGKE
jgi:hypothetical protein